MTLNIPNILTTTIDFLVKSPIILYITKSNKQTTSFLKETTKT